MISGSSDLGGIPCASSDVKSSSVGVLLWMIRYSVRAIGGRIREEGT
jgi:hypothetical protein